MPRLGLVKAAVADCDFFEKKRLDDAGRVCAYTIDRDEAIEGVANGELAFMLMVRDQGLNNACNIVLNDVKLSYFISKKPGN